MPEPMAHEPVEKTMGFDGAWMPDFDPSKMGEENFSELKNYRYVEDGIEPIEGYSAITTNPCNATYLKIRDGIQLRQNIGTATSYVIVFAWNSAETAGRVYENKGAVPAAADFETAALFTPTSPTNPRFSHLPRGIGFCTGTETVIYEGDEANPGIVILADDYSGLSYTNPQDFTEEMSNTLSGTNNLMTFAAASQNCIIIGTTRRMTSFNVTMKTGNVLAAVMVVKEWTAGSWSAVGNLVDGTQSPAGTSMGKSGTVSWDANSNALPTFIDNVYLYHYAIDFGDAGTGIVQQITVNMPMQNALDIWDGVFRTCISYQAIINAADAADYTLEVNEESNIDFPISAKMDNFRQDAGDYLIVGAEERSTALKVEMLGGRGNTNASVLTIYYWDGDSWVTVGTVVDGTLSGGATHGVSGVISWNPPDQYKERSQTLYGVTGYFYKVAASLQWDAEVEVDFVSLIPRPKEVTAHIFPAKFSERAFFGGPVGEENALDYTATSTVDVHNGLDSSAHGQRIYVGGGERLTAARSVYNRFGSSIYETLLIFKNNETYLLTGTGPADFRLFRVSENYGCPAPRTLVGAEVGYQMGGGAYRNVVMWMSYRGPVIFDGAVILPITGVDLYFDTRKTDTVINTTYIANSVAWFDPFWKEFHLMIPTGSATTLDTHIVYDLTRKKWWKCNYDGGASDIPQFGMVVRDTTGSAYPYVCRNDGHMLRFGDGTDWDGNDLTHLVKSADIMPGGFFNLAQMQMLKVGHQVPDFISTDADIAMTLNCYIDGAVDAVSLSDFNIAVSNFVEEQWIYTEASDTIINEAAADTIIFDQVNKRRYTRHIVHLDKVVHSIAFEFSRTSTSASYLSNFGKSLLWWGFRAAIVGRDERGDETD